MTLQQQVDHAVRSILKSLMFGEMYGRSSPSRGAQADTASSLRRVHEGLAAQLATVNSLPQEDLPLFLAAAKEPSFIVTRMAVHRLQTGESIPRPSSIEEMLPYLFANAEARLEDVEKRILASDYKPQVAVSAAPMATEQAEQMVAAWLSGFPGATGKFKEPKEGTP